jgi:hypothetical protein
MERDSGSVDRKWEQVFDDGAIQTGVAPVRFDHTNMQSGIRGGETSAVT